MSQTYYWIYDIETFSNVFTFSIIREDGKYPSTFEVSARRHELNRVISCIEYLKKQGDKMVGFNNLGFDYPVLHEIYAKKAVLLKLPGESAAKEIFTIAQEQIESAKDGFARTVPDEEQHVCQVDLYKIMHFDNKAKATSLKTLEFNMKSSTIEDLPFSPFDKIEVNQIDIIRTYNVHDVKMTLEFFKHNRVAVEFREQLTAKYGRNFMNHNDTKIGKDYFIMELEKQLPGSCYRIENGRRKMNQTKRPYIDIKDCLFPYYDFTRPEFISVLQWFKRQRIKETKGVFADIEEHRLGDVAKYADMVVKRVKFKSKPTETDLREFYTQHPLGWVEEQELQATEYLLDENGNHVLEYQMNEDGTPDLTKKPKKKRVPKKSYWGCYRVAENLNVVVDGFRFDFGTGGIHGSIESKVARSTAKYQIIDADVSSMYPNIAISNRVYPEHLSEKFCDIYEEVYKQRKSYPKGSAENLMLKLALNGVYGDSNNEFSPFYDPKYTMTITINGQLSLCLLAEKLLKIEGLKIIQVNTDGITVACPYSKRNEYDDVCAAWQKQVGLQLEFAEYDKMFIRDVNNYIAVYTDGKVKRKGAYQYEGLGWHQDQSALVIKKAAEAAMLHGADIRQFICQHLKNPDNKWDFMLRAKVPRNSSLVLELLDGTVVKQQNICRYYVSNTGGKLVKIMPPLEGKTEERRMGIEAAWLVKTCNNIEDYDADVNIDYYVQEAEKLVVQ